jgi:hypothetical protein
MTNKWWIQSNVLIKKKNIERSNSYSDDKGDEILLDYRLARTNKLCFVIIIIL